MQPSQPSPPAQPWRKLGERSIDADADSQQVRDMLKSCLPDALPLQSLRASAEEAVLEAIRRRRHSGDSLPVVIVSCLEGCPDSALDQALAGWSFFIIERPAPAPSAGSHTGEIIEICLYHE